MWRTNVTSGPSRKIPLDRQSTALGAKTSPDENRAVWHGSAYISKMNERNSIRYTLVTYFMPRINKEGITWEVKGGRHQVWWPSTAIPTFGRLRQGDEELKASFGCKVRPKNKENQREVLKEREIQREGEGETGGETGRYRGRWGEKSGLGSRGGEGRAGGSHTDNIHG